MIKSSTLQPFNEKEQLAELDILNILDIPPDKYFDRYTLILSQIFKVPMVAVSLVAEDRQWLKSSVGIEENAIPLEESFCFQTLKRGVMEIQDTLEDPFFSHHPLVVGPPFIRFYMGTVLRGSTGQPLGTLYIMDTQSRYLTRVQRSWLITFGNLVEELINHDHALHDAHYPVEKVNHRNTLTGLPDEILFGNTLKHLIRLSNEEKQNLAILHLRVNKIEEINRVHGRSARDAILHGLAERLTAPDSKVISAGHLSLAHFGAVIPLKTSRDLFDVINPIATRLTSTMEFEGTRIRPDIDIGISLSPLDGITPEDLMDRALTALKGPSFHEGVYVFSQKIEETALRQHAIEQLLEPALLEKRMSNLFQPQLSADGSCIVGFEALARWQDQTLGSISPEEFIPIVEKNARLSRLLTEWSLKTVCGGLSQWPLGASDPPLRFAVNIPARQFYQEGFVDQVLHILDKHKLAPERLSLELTEESLLANADKAVQTMRELRSHNIHISLDDFGTGYSSLSYLNKLPLDTLKIDKSFIDDLPHDSRAVDLVNGIIRIGRGFGLKIVAEGVEHEPQRALLQELGCDVIQGYLFSRPLPANNALELLKSWPQK